MHAVQGVSARMARGMTDGPAARQGKRIARLFSELITSAASGAPPRPGGAASAGGSAGGKADDFDGTLGAEETPEVRVGASRYLWPCISCRREGALWLRMWLRGQRG